MMESLTTLERLPEVNYGGDVNRIGEDYCSTSSSSFSSVRCRSRPKNNSTGQVKHRNNNSSRRKYYNQEVDPGEMSSSVGLCRNSYSKQTFHDQPSATSLMNVTGDPVGLVYTALSKYTTTDNWSSESDTLLNRLSDVADRDPSSPLLNQSVHLSDGQAATTTTLQATNSQTTITTNSVGPYTMVKALSSPSSFLPSFASTNVDVDIQSRKLTTTGGMVHSTSSSSSSSTTGVGVESNSVGFEDTIYEKTPHEKESEHDQGKEALLRGVFSCEDDTLQHERTMENTITKKLTRSRRHLQRSVCKTNNAKTPDHNITATNDNCSNNDLTEVSDHCMQKLGCSRVCATDTVASSTSSSSYVGTLCERHPSSSLLETWPAFNNNSSPPYTRPHTQTNNYNNNNNINNKTLIRNTTILPTSQTATNIPSTTTITTLQENVPSRSVSDFFIFNYLTSMWSSRFTNFCSCAEFLDTCRRHTSLTTRSATWKLRNYFLLAINILVFFTCVAGQCKVSTCQKQWPTYQMNSMGMDTPSDPHNCRALRTTWHCIKKVSNGCVGNIDYHSEKSRVQKQMSIRKCSLKGETYDSVGHTHRTTVQIPQPECMYKGKGTYKHCGLFGDPHLRTFDRVCQTCKIRGAWALVDNKQLTVMVTNKPVVVDGSATATSMLTVRIRRNELCGANHFVTYETQANHLPSTFVDGRTHYGPGNGIELEVLKPHKHIKIHIKYIDTTILVRQIGRYFTFALWMPEEVVNDSNGNELCVRGCPKSEQINYQEFLAQKHQKLMEFKTQNKLVMSRHDAETLCRQAKVVDFYFDSCVFDLMTTGDKNFTVAAYSALHDLLELNPEVVKSNKNRTDFRPYDQMFNGSISTRTMQTIPTLIILCMTLLSLNIGSRL